MEWTEKFANWLKKGKEDAEKLLDIPWDIEVSVGGEGEEKDDIITAMHPKIPFPIMIRITARFANLIMDTGVPTDARSVEERMRLYKKLLHMNTKFILMKTCLVGEEHRVMLTVDLDLASLNKKEFNDALTSLIFGVPQVIEALGFTEELSKTIVSRAAEMVSEKIKEGVSKDDIMEFLVHRVGMDRDVAKEFMKTVIESLAGQDARDEPDLIYIH